MLLGGAWLPLSSAQATTSPTPTPPLILVEHFPTIHQAVLAAKVGSLTAAWVDPEFGANVWGAVASDPTNGPLIAVNDGSGKVWAKEGSLTAGWVEEFTGAEDADCGRGRSE